MSDAVGSSSRSEKSASAFRTISEVSQDLDVPQHVLRFWETKFSQVKPLKRAGGRRYYRPEDISLLRCIRDLLYADGFTIRGVQKRLREKGVKGLIAEMEGGSAGNTVPQDSAVQADRPTQEGASASEPPKVQIDALRSTEAAPSQTVERSSANKAELQSVKEELENLLHDVRTARQSS